MSDRHDQHPAARDGAPPDEGPGVAGVWRRRVLALAAAAIALRLLLFLGRGDYLAFDEGWYLLLARSLFTGEGYSLIGIPHVALSPLFPVLAGAAGVVLDSWVWGGRVVAAVASGLLVLPAWSIFRRLIPARTAFVGAALVAVLPSMAPFVVAYWVGADLWVGAEPLLHLFLYLGIALWLRADDRDESLSWGLSGAALALAYLARPEAIIAWGLLGLGAVGFALARRSPRRLAGAALLGLGFAVVAAPYWFYLHDATGRWSVTGRGIAPATTQLRALSGETRPAPASAIERMLWADDESYEQRLYALDESGVRLRSAYWGIYPEARPGADLPSPGGPAAAESGARDERPPPDAAAGGRAPVEAGPGAGPGADLAREPPTLLLYGRALGRIFPLLLWLFVALGVVGPRPPGMARKELPVAGALLGTSLAVAGLVAVDPRTQLLLVPLLALYAARGMRLVEETVRERMPGGELRSGFVELGVAAVAVVWLLAINGERLYLSLAYGSPHHIVATQNRAVARELDTLLENGGGPVASWHPAVAVYADRDWRVVPFAPLGEIIRYEQAAGAEAMVLSAYYPPDLGVESLDTRYLVLPIPDGGTLERGWRLEIARGDTIRRVGRLEPIE